MTTLETILVIIAALSLIVIGETHLLSDTGRAIRSRFRRRPTLPRAWVEHLAELNTPAVWRRSPSQQAQRDAVWGRVIEAQAREVHGG